MNCDAPDGVWFAGEWGDVPLVGWPGPHYGIMELDPMAAGIPTMGDATVVILAIGLLGTGWHLIRRTAHAKGSA